MFLSSINFSFLVCDFVFDESFSSCFLSLGFWPFSLGVAPLSRGESWPFLLWVGVGQLCVVTIVIIFE